MNVSTQLWNGKFISGTAWIESDEHRLESLVQLVGILDFIHKVNPDSIVAVHYKEVRKDRNPPESYFVEKVVCPDELTEAKRRYVVQKIDRLTESWNSEDPMEFEDTWDSESGEALDPADI